MIKLYVKKGLVFEEFVFESETCVIGRDEGCDLSLNGKGLSRTHCKIINNGLLVTIDDLGSSNGTFVDGVKIDSEQELCPGDKVSLGEDLFYFGQLPDLNNQQVFLQVLSGPHEGVKVDLGNESVVLGRKGCDVSLSNDSGVSQRHAVVEVGSAGWVVKDLGSSNGLWVNKLRVETINLSQNHVFRIGKTLLFVGTDEDLKEIQDKKNIIKRDIGLVKKMPVIVSVVLAIVVVLAFILRPADYHDSRINKLLNNSSFESVSNILEGWDATIKSGLEIKLSDDAMDGKHSLMVLGAQSIGTLESKLVYANPIEINNDTITYKVDIQTDLQSGVVQLALLYKDVNGDGVILRGRSWCASNKYASFEDYFVIPKGVERVQPAFLFYGIDGTVLIDDVAIYDGGVGAVMRRSASMSFKKSMVTIGSAGNLCFSVDAKVGIANLELVKRYVGGVLRSQTMGYLTSDLICNASSASIKGVLYDIDKNMFEPYQLNCEYVNGAWNVVPSVADASLVYGLDLSSHVQDIEAFSVADKEVFLSADVKSQLLSEVLVLKNPVQSVIFKDEQPFEFTLRNQGMSVIADRNDKVRVLQVLNYSPQFNKSSKKLLVQAKLFMSEKDFSKASKVVRSILNSKAGTEFILSARKIQEDIKIKSSKTLSDLKLTFQRLRVDMPEHRKKIAQFYNDCRQYEVRFAGLPVEKQIRVLRKNLQKKQRDYDALQMNLAANKLVEKIRKVISKGDFVLAGQLLTKFESDYAMSKAYTQVQDLYGYLNKCKKLKQIEMNYIEGRYKLVENFEKNRLYDAIKRVYEEILNRYPDNAETKLRLKLIELKIREQE